MSNVSFATHNISSPLHSAFPCSILPSTVLHIFLSSLSYLLLFYSHIQSWKQQFDRLNFQRQCTILIRLLIAQRNNSLNASVLCIHVHAHADEVREKGVRCVVSIASWRAVGHDQLCWKIFNDAYDVETIAGQVDAHEGNHSYRCGNVRSCLKTRSRSHVHVFLRFFLFLSFRKMSNSQKRSVKLKNRWNKFYVYLRSA